jgi:polyisoprenoid-binding protein YceI
MKKRAISLLVCCSVLVAGAQQYSPVLEGSSISFKIKNFGFNVSGSFSGLQGEILFDPGNLGTCSFDVRIDAKSVNTGIDMRDNHLREEDYFDVKNYPNIRFVSTRVTPSNKSGILFIFGKLTIKKKTLDISFPFTATPAADGFVFSGDFKINRRNFEVGGSSTVSDNLEVFLKVAVKNVKK